MGHYIGPNDHDVGLLTKAQADYWTAIWQAKVLGWIWQADRRMMTRPPKGRGRPKGLKRTAIEVLSRAWSGLEETDSVLATRTCSALRWFFPPDEVTHAIVLKTMYDRL